MTRKLNVFLYGKKTGVLSEDAMGHLNFEYDSMKSYPLSVRMPVKPEIYGPTYTEPFFNNLTPEGEAIGLIASKFHISEENTFSILNKIGGDCAGAVSLYPNDIEYAIDNPLKEIDERSIAKIIDKLPTNPLLTGMANAPRLSLAGAQSKFAVYKSKDGKYYRSDEDHPTTHIIKIANKYYEDLLENELFCMTLAQTIFKDAIDVNMNIADGRKYLEIQRYDRQNTRGKITRIHQEDFCQVLGYLNSKKYQSDGGPKIPQVYGAILEYSSQRVADAYKFIQMLIFNYLVGNTDAHAKNFSFLHIDKANGVILSPVYDIVSIDIYPQSIVSHEIAMTINGKGTFESIKARDWIALFEQLRMNPTTTMQEMRQVFGRIVQDSEQLAERLNAAPLTKSDIYKKILQNIKTRYNALFVTE